MSNVNKEYQVENDDPRIINPQAGVQKFFALEKEKAAKIALGHKSTLKMTDEDIADHKANLARFSQMVRRMTSKNNNTAFITDKKRICSIPVNNLLSVQQKQIPPTFEDVGDSDVGSFMKNQYSNAQSEREFGLHNKSVKIHMEAFEEAIHALPEEDKTVLNESLNPKFAYDPTRDCTTRSKKMDSVRHSVVVSEGEIDFWSMSQKLARVLPHILAGGPGNNIRGPKHAEKTFMLLFMALTGLRKLPEQGSQEAKNVVYDLYGQFFAYTCDEVEPLAASDGYPVAFGNMDKSIEEGECYVRGASEDGGTLLYDIVYTCSFADKTMKLYQEWCTESTDHRYVLRISPRLLEFIYDLSERLLGPGYASHIPFLIRNYKDKNPKCKASFEVSHIAEKACTNWKHPQSQHVGAEQVKAMLSSWADSAYSNPSIKFKWCDEEGNERVSFKLLFFGSTPEKEFVDETLLRIGGYDSANNNTQSVKALIAQFVGILSKITCFAAGINDTMYTSLVVQQDRNPPNASAAESRKRKKTDEFSGDINALLSSVASLVEEVHAIKTAMDTAQRTLKEVQTSTEEVSTQNKEQRTRITEIEGSVKEIKELLRPATTCHSNDTDMADAQGDKAGEQETEESVLLVHQE